MKRNRKAISLIIVMGIVLVTGLLSITIIELIIPFSRSVFGMENSSKAYYLANAGIEEAMLNIRKNNEESNNSNNIIVKDKKFNIISGNTNSIVGNNIFSDRILTVEDNIEPEIGKGDSEYDKDYNIISTGNPIQMDITGNSIFLNLKAYFKIPIISTGYELIGTKINKDSGLQEEICYISWQISSEKGFINSSKDNCLKKTDINNNEIEIKNLGKNIPLSYIDENGEEQNLTLENIYNSICPPSIKKCILKFSLIDELLVQRIGDSSSVVKIPYLEWKLSSSSNFKLRYSTIESTGKSNNFVKKLEVKVPQATVNEAFDFTVFQ